MNKRKSQDINYKDLSKVQLENLKKIYVMERVKTMSDSQLRNFVQEVLELQVLGTVGNDEERETWQEMKEYFALTFVEKLEAVMKSKKADALLIKDDQEELKERLAILENQKNMAGSHPEDMWSDN